jgi:hypothetical protein
LAATIDTDLPLKTNVQAFKGKWLTAIRQGASRRLRVSQAMNLRRDNTRFTNAHSGRQHLDQKHLSNAPAMPNSRAAMDLPEPVGKQTIRI